MFESQRIADDTSGHDWERTRRFGVNGLSHRIAQHRTFSHIDPDCVAITSDVGWRQTSQWMDVVARSGTSLFFSPAPAAVTPEIKSAMKIMSKVFLLACLLMTSYAVSAPTQGSVNHTPSPTTLPGRGLAEHDFMYAGESHDRRIFIVRQGKIVWSYDDPAGVVS